jgi:flagellar hook-associated protein 3 FlgL
MLSSFYTDAAQSFSNQEASLALLEQQLSTGQAVSTASANPAAFVTAARDTASETVLASEATAQTNVQSQLGVASTALEQASTVLDHLQSIALQATNATENSQDLQALSEQVGTSLQQRRTRSPSFRPAAVRFSMWATTASPWWRSRPGSA